MNKGFNENVYRVAEILDNRNAEDIILIDIREQSILADYFVICNGTSSTQIRSLADEVEYKLSLCGITPNHTEGKGNGGWVLID